MNPYRGEPPCEGCEGKGKRLVWDGMGEWDAVPCARCKGTGVACPRCRGGGRLLASSDPDESQTIACPSCESYGC